MTNRFFFLTAMTFHSMEIRKTDFHNIVNSTDNSILHMGINHSLQSSVQLALLPVMLRNVSAV